MTPAEILHHNAEEQLKMESLKMQNEEYKTIEKVLLESEEKCKFLFNHSADTIFIFDTSGAILCL